MNNQDYPVPSKSMGLLETQSLMLFLEMVSSLLAELRGPRPSRKARNPKRKTLVESIANLLHLRIFSHRTWIMPHWFRRKFRLSKSHHLLICSFHLFTFFFAFLFRCFFSGRTTWNNLKLSQENGLKTLTSEVRIKPLEEFTCKDVFFHGEKHTNNGSSVHGR